MVQDRKKVGNPWFILIQARTQRGDAGYASAHQTYRGVDMTLDFIENHRQKYFCTAHYSLKMLRINLC